MKVSSIYPLMIACLIGTALSGQTFMESALHFNGFSVSGKSGEYTTDTWGGAMVAVGHHFTGKRRVQPLLSVGYTAANAIVTRTVTSPEGSSSTGANFRLSSLDVCAGVQYRVGAGKRGYVDLLAYHSQYTMVRDVIVIAETTLVAQSEPTTRYDVRPQSGYLRNSHYGLMATCGYEFALNARFLLAPQVSLIHSLRNIGRFGDDNDGEGLYPFNTRLGLRLSYVVK